MDQGKRETSAHLNANSREPWLSPEPIDIAMPPEEWEVFCKALAAPPRRIPALQNLLSQPSIFPSNPFMRLA